MMFWRALLFGQRVAGISLSRVPEGAWATSHNIPRSNQSCGVLSQLLAGTRLVGRHMHAAQATHVGPVLVFVSNSSLTSRLSILRCTTDNKGARRELGRALPTSCT